MIRFLDLQKITALHGDEIAREVSRVVSGGWYLRGEQTQHFEKEYADYIGTCHCVGCGNGLDALSLIYRAYKEMGRLHEGDEVIVPANTYIASILAITENGLKPVLAEPRADTLELDASQLEHLLTPRTRSVMLVHLYGRCAYSDEIGDFCAKNGLLLVEDNAQAHGCRSAKGSRTGSLGHAAGHSFYPGKNLGALGDGGAVTTDDAELAEVVRSLGNYGSSEKYVFRYRGRNSRLDELQAAVLRVKLRHLDDDNRRRTEIARIYEEEICNQLITLPRLMPKWQNVYHVFPVLCRERDLLQAHLTANDIQTIIHYPIPPHRQECFREWNTMQLPITERIHNNELSLPISPVMTADEARSVVAAVNAFGR